MKRIEYIVIIVMSIMQLSCKKVTSIEVKPISSVNIVNAINGANGVKLNMNRDIAAVNSYSIQAIDAGLGGIKAYDAVSNTVYYNQSQITENGGLYSLYLTGTITAPEGVWIKDNIKPYGSDNTTTTVRVANLSPNSGPVSVTLASAVSTNVFSNVTYKAVTAFQDFPLPLTILTNTNVFQFRDAGGAIIASFTLPASARNRSYTIILKGLIGGAGNSAIGVIGQQHY